MSDLSPFFWQDSMKITTELKINPRTYEPIYDVRADDVNILKLSCHTKWDLMHFGLDVKSELTQALDYELQNSNLKLTPEQSLKIAKFVTKVAMSGANKAELKIENVIDSSSVQCPELSSSIFPTLHPLDEDHVGDVSNRLR